MIVLNRLLNQQCFILQAEETDRHTVEEGVKMALDAALCTVDEAVAWLEEVENFYASSCKCNGTL